MYESFVRLGLVAVGVIMAGMGWATDTNGTEGEASSNALATLRPGRNLDMNAINAEPLLETLKGIHEFWWGPLETPPWEPYRYVNWVMELSRMKKLMRIASEGSDAERAELLQVTNDWLDRYLTEYPTVNYVGNTAGHAGFSVLHPGMDAALTLILAELDPSRESLERIAEAFDLHVDALRFSHERNNVQKQPDDDGVARSQTTHVFGVAAVLLVENARKRELKWLMDDDDALPKYEAALEISRKNERMLHDYVAIIEVTRSEMTATEE